jgi:hypothetical protein
MNFARWFRLNKGRKRRRCRPRLCVERLEDRTAPAGHTIATATTLTFDAFSQAQVSGFLASPNQVDLYAVQLSTNDQYGDQITASVDAQGAGSGLQSVLRVFNAQGQQVALSDPLAGDPSLTFQPAVSGTYYLGISSAGDDQYNPNTGIGASGTTSGNYTLNLDLHSAQQTTPLSPNVVGEEFRLASPTATWGGTVTLNALLGNQGGSDPKRYEGFSVNVLLSPDSSFSSSAVQTLTTIKESGGLPPGTPLPLNDLQVTLPTNPPSGFSATGPVYVGIKVNPNFFGDLGGQHLGTDYGLLQIVTSVTANGDNTNPQATKMLTDLNSQVSGTLASGTDTQWFTFAVTGASGDFTAGVDPTFDPALTLYAADGKTVLFRSNNVLPTNTNALLTQYLQPGTYFLAVSSQNGAGGAYTLTTQFTPGTSPLKPTPLVSGYFNNKLIQSAGLPGPFAVTSADFNGDGKIDLAVAQGVNTVGVLLGNGDGSFQPEQLYPSGGHDPFAITTADVNGDGKPDLIVVNRYSTSGANDGSVAVLLNNGNGTFAAPKVYNVGGFPFAVSVADINGDGNPDIIVANHNNDTVTILLNNGNGSFSNTGEFPVRPPALANGSNGPFLSSMTVADVNGDGKPDIITTDYHYGQVSVLLNTTTAGATTPTFAPPETFPAGSDPVAVAVADLSGDGKPDIAVANYVAGTVSVLLNQTAAGAKTASFAAPQAFAAGNAPYAIVAADLNGDGKPDLAVTNFSTGTVSVLLNTSAGGTTSFAAPETFAAGRAPVGLTVADINGDGKPDLVVANYIGDNVSVLLGNGDGSFLSQQGEVLISVKPATFEGRPGLVVADATGTVTEFLRNSGGSFTSLPSFTVAGGLTSVQEADLNGDGIPDLVVANATGTVSVLLGNGDGSFSTEQTFHYGPGVSIALGDVNGDGKPDLIVVDPSTDTAHVLLGNGDGTFHPVVGAFDVGPYPTSITIVDLNGDGRADLIVADHKDSQIAVLLGNGDGTFQAPTFTRVPYGVSEVTVADMNGDGIPDLVATNNRLGGAAALSGSYFSIATVLLGKGDGTFQAGQAFAVGPPGTPIAVADMNGDGEPDLVATYYNSGAVKVFLNTTSKRSTSVSFAGAGANSILANANYTLPIGHSLSSVAFADINGDGLSDVIVPAAYGRGISVFPNTTTNGTISFGTTPSNSQAQQTNTPLQADLTGDGLPDTVILDGSGNILLRLGQPGGGSTPPVVLNNTNTGPSRANAPSAKGAVDLPASDIAVVNTPAGMEIAAADAGQKAVTLYHISTDAQGNVQVTTTTFSTPFFVSRIVAADLNGDGLDDLIMADGSGNDVAVSLQMPGGSFGTPVEFPTGLAPADIAVADENGDGRPDLVVSSATGGNVTVLLNTMTTGATTPSFAAPQIFAATTGPHGTVTPSSGQQAIGALDQLGGMTIGDFSGTGHNDLAVINQATRAIDLLSADGRGGFDNPQVGLSLGTGGAIPLAIVSGDFNRDGKPDLAVLVEQPDLSVVDESRDEVLIFSNNGDGTFSLTDTVPVGSFATGLSVVPGSGPGLLDLLVGDQFGNVLRLVGKGDGSFQVAGSNVSLAMLNGQSGVVVANQQANHVTVQVPAGAGQFSAVQQINLPADSAPNQVQFFPLNQNGTPSMILVGSGSNNVIIGQLGPNGFTQTGNYFVGSNPASVTMADVNGDGIPDLIVADQGSNQVSILFGTYVNGIWTGTPGPRLETGGFGPISATIEQTPGQANPDLVVTNAQSGTLTVFQGIGQGYFEPTPVKTISIGSEVIQAPVPLSPGSSQDVGVASNGELFLVNMNDLSAGVQFVSAPAGIAAVTPMNGALVAALDNGLVDVLQFDPSLGAFTPVLQLNSLSGALPPNPTDITVLPTAGGFEALVATAGSDQLFVFGLEPPGSESAPFLSEQGPSGGTQTTAAPPTEAPLVLIVTLQAPTLPETEEGAEQVVQTETSVAEAAAAGVGEGDTSDDVEVATAADVPGSQTDEPVGEKELSEDASDSGPGIRIVQFQVPQTPDADAWQRSLAALWQSEPDPWPLDVLLPETLGNDNDADPVAFVWAQEAEADRIADDAGPLDAGVQSLSADDAAAWWAAAGPLNLGEPSETPQTDVLVSNPAPAPGPEPTSDQGAVAAPLLEVRCEPEEILQPALAVAGLAAWPLSRLGPALRPGTVFLPEKVPPPPPKWRNRRI